MFYREVEGVVARETAKLVKPVREFIDNHVMVYDTEHSEAKEFHCWSAYMKAAEAIDSWMALVVRADAIEFNETHVYATLKLPEREHEYTSDVSVSGETLEGNHLPMIYTPIGEMNYFVYRCIADIPDNPVILFYKAMQEQIRRVHTLIMLSPENDGQDDLITKAILDVCGIRDVLNICKLDSCLTHIDEFFDGHGFHERFSAVQTDTNNFV